MSERKAAGFFLSFVGDGSAFGQDVLSIGPKIARKRHWEPRVDINEDEREVIVTVEIAGVHGDEISLSLQPDANTLTVRGSRQEPASEGRRIAHQLEIPFGEFEREVILPDIPLAMNEVSAACKNGFLVVLIPKA